MKVTIVGNLVAFRWDEKTKGNVRLGQADIVQHGDGKFPTTICIVEIPDTGISHLVIRAFEEIERPLVAFLCWIQDFKGELKCIVLECLSIANPREGSLDGITVPNA